MRLLRSIVLTIFVVFSALPPAAQAYWLWSPSEGKFVSPEGVSKRTAEEQFDYALQYRDRGEQDKMLKALRDLVNEYPQSQAASEAQFTIAVTYDEEGDYPKASEALQKLIRDFPRFEKLDDAMERLFRIGNLFLTGAKQKLLGIAVIPVLPKAAEVFQFIVDQAPYGPYGDQAMLKLGMAQRKMGERGEAVETFKRLIENYPDSFLGDEAQYQLAEASFELSQAAGRDERANLEAEEHLGSFIDRYRSSSLAERAKTLMRELREQDAEKNYQIARYYEKQGFIESAMIYYEDVAKRYGDTKFGKKAAERSRKISEPERAMESAREGREKRLAEVDSLLATLRAERSKKNLDERASDAQRKLQKDLEAERSSLLAQEALFEKKALQEYKEQADALKNRQKRLKEKFRTFKSRKKQALKHGAGPELESVLARWESSLVKEQEEIARERRSLAALGIKTRRLSWLVPGRLPFVGEEETPARDRVLTYREKEWRELTDARLRTAEERKHYESELSSAAQELEHLEKIEFNTAREFLVFNELLPEDLKQKARTARAEQKALNELARELEASKNRYRNQFGEAFLSKLAEETGLFESEAGALVLELKEEIVLPPAANLEDELTKLKWEQEGRMEAWLEQRKKVETMAQAAGKDLLQKTALGTLKETAQLLVKSGEKLQAPAAQEPAPLQAEEARKGRILAKRIKFVEREIRQRLDQIQDWESENAGRLSRLEELLRGGRGSSAGSRGAIGKIASPVTGAFKLGKIFIFGLPDRERELNRRTEEALLADQGAYSSEMLNEIRRLHEDIELQSILIQGRAQEVLELEGELNRLKSEGAAIPGFSYQSMLVARHPFSLEHSLASAARLLDRENRETVYLKRFGEEKAALENLERSLETGDQKIQAVSAALEERAKQASQQPAGEQTSVSIAPETKQKGGVEAPQPVQISVSGSAETLPQESVAQNQKTFENELTELSARVRKKAGQVNKWVTDFEAAAQTWYRQDESSRKLIQAMFFPAERAVLDEEKNAGEKTEGIRKQFLKLTDEEVKRAQSQKEFLAKKAEALEKRLKRLARPSAAYRGVLTEEITKTRRLEHTLVEEITALSGVLKK